MLASVFRRNQPMVFVALVVIVPALWMPAALQDAWRHGGAYMPLFQPLAAMMDRWSWSGPLLGMLFTIGISVQLSVLAGDAELMERRNHLPALLFPLLLALFPGRLHADAALAGLPLLLWAFRRAWVDQDRGRGLGALFNAGLLVGAAALVYLPYLFMVVVIWASTAVTRPFHWRDHLVPLVAAGFAFYLCWGVLLLGGASSWHPMATISEPYQPGTAGSSWSLLRPALVLVAILAVFTTFAFVKSYRRSIMHGKNMRSAFLAFTLAAFLITAFEGIVRRSAPASPPAAALAVLFAYPLLSPRRAWLAEVGALALAALAAWTQWGQLSSPA